MHLADGYLSDPVCVVTTAASLAAVGAGLVQLRRTAQSGLALPLAVTAAGVFAAQMVNFPVSVGASGHLVGAALATWIVGPWAALVAMSWVLLTQCLAFGDGGFTALGANLLNMAVCGVLVSDLVKRAAVNRLANPVMRIALGCVAAWCSVMAGATLCSFELALSGVQPLTEVLPAMLNVHAWIGLGESLITMVVLSVVRSFHLQGNAAATKTSQFADRRPALAWLGVAFAVAALVAPLASGAPDGLERVALDLGFARFAENSIVGLAPDYLVPGVQSPMLAAAFAGMLGVAGVFAACYWIGQRACCRACKH